MAGVGEPVQIGVGVGVGQLEYLSINLKCCTQHTNRN